MTVTQADIDQLPWFHDFDFPGGLRARSVDRPNAVFHTLLWSFMRDQLTRVEFTGERVIDVGCWDDYFSFLAEERGASYVLAVDDYSQNWGAKACFRLAHGLKGSRVDFRPGVSVYALDQAVHATFDIVLLLGVYYHLHAPYLALAQLRQLCHAESVVVIEGDCIADDTAAYAHFALDNPHSSIFIPTTRLLRDMLRSCYLQVEHMALLSSQNTPDMLAQVDRAALFELVRRRRSGGLGPLQAATGPRRDRVVIFARPFEGRNPDHTFRPPFGLDRFDERHATKWAAVSSSDATQSA